MKIEEIKAGELLLYKAGVEFRQLEVKGVDFHNGVIICVDSLSRRVLTLNPEEVQPVSSEEQSPSQKESVEDSNPLE